MAKRNAAGGPASRVVREVGVKKGSPAKGVSPRGVSQIGSSMGNHASEQQGKILRGGVDPIYRGKPQPRAAYRLEMRPRREAWALGEGERFTLLAHRLSMDRWPELRSLKDATRSRPSAPI